MCILMISFRPFMAEPETDGGGSGDIINQLGFSLLGVGVIAALATLTDPRKVARIVGFGWSLMFLLLFASLMQSVYPGVVMRGAVFTMIGVCCVVPVWCCCRRLARMGQTRSSHRIPISGAGCSAIKMSPVRSWRLSLFRGSISGGGAGASAAH
jgi:Na+(H+)/acetate symporter ActP